MATLDEHAISETSGVVASRTYPGVFWAHGDSGNPARLVAFDRTGRMLAAVAIDAVNADWEDITTDADGHLFIGDIGNYRGWFSLRQIYKIGEPDPYHPPRRPVKPLAVWQYELPPDNRFDAEALYWRGGALYVLAHGRGSRKLFRLVPSPDPARVRLQFVVSIPLLSATGADCSKDGKRLVICGYHRCVIIALSPDGAWDRSVRPLDISYPRGGGIEAVAFDGDAVVLAAENGEVFRVSQPAFERHAHFAAPVR